MSNNEKLKILLINPHGFDVSSVIPLSLGYLKSNVAHPDNFEIRILDCSLLDITSDSLLFKDCIRNFGPKVVGITTWSPMYDEALRCARVAKSIDADIATAMGGPHPSGYWENVIKNEEIDFVFRGESENDFSLFLDRMFEGRTDFDDIEGLVFKDEDGTVVGGKVIGLVEDLDSIKLPDYEVIELPTYIERGYKYLTRESYNAPIWATRGCPYRCEFCASPMISGKAVRKHSPKYLVDWIHHLKARYGIKHVNIIDDNFTFHVKYAKEVCNDLIAANLQVTISTPNGIRMNRGDTDLWQLMYQAGWRTMFVAPESGSANTLGLMKKDLDLSVVPPIIRDMQAAGLYVIGFFILGYPGETYDDLLETRKFVMKCGFDFFKFHVFQAIPGTPIYDKLVLEGQISTTYLPSEYHNFALATQPQKSFEFPDELTGKKLSSLPKVSAKGHYKNPNLIGVSYRKYILSTYTTYYIKHMFRALNLFRYFGLRFIALRVSNTFGLIDLIPGKSNRLNWARK